MFFLSLWFREINQGIIDTQRRAWIAQPLDVCLDPISWAAAVCWTGGRIMAIGSFLSFPFLKISHLFFLSSYPTSSFFLSSLISLAKCHLGWREKLKELLNLIEEGKLYGWLVFLRLFSTEGGGKWPHLSSLLFQHADFSSFFFVSLSGSTGPGWRLRLSVCKRRGARKGRKWPLRHWCSTLFSAERTGWAGHAILYHCLMTWHHWAHTHSVIIRVLYYRWKAIRVVLDLTTGPQRRWNHSPNPSLRLETNRINLN